MNDKLPIIDQIHNAPDDRARAAVLLRCPDNIMLKYEDVFLGACRQFPAGEYFVLQRTIALRHVRSEVGALPGGLALELETLRAELAAYAAGAPLIDKTAKPDPLWPPNQDGAPQPAGQGPPSIDI